MKKPKPFFTKAKKEFDELDDLPQQEQELIFGIAKLAIYSNVGDETAEQTIEKSFPRLSHGRKENVTLALEYLLSLVDDIKVK